MTIHYLSRLVRLTTLSAVVLVGILAFGFARPTHAQLSCRIAPAPFDDPDLLARARELWTRTDFCRFKDGVFNSIISGGIPRDGIAPIDEPVFESQETALEWLQPQSPVIAVEVNGIARAYPLAILSRHEIVNDYFGDTPVAVTYCPLCNSAVVFERWLVPGATPLRFGVSGLLLSSDTIMWDDQTETWWQQFTGEGIVGRYTGTRLRLLSSQMVGFEAFATRFPEGEVLSRDSATGAGDYSESPYSGYDSSDSPFAFRGELDTRLFPTSRVLAGVIGGRAIAYPFDALAEEVVVNDRVNDRNVVAFWQPGATSALDQTSIDDSRDVGMAGLYSRQVQGRVLDFTYDAETNRILDTETGSEWNVFGTALSGPFAGQQLRQISAGPHLWFAWAAFQPGTQVYGLDSGLVMDEVEG